MPELTAPAHLLSATRTADELSIVCPTDRVPANATTPPHPAADARFGRPRAWAGWASNKESMDYPGNIFVVEWVEVGRVTKLRNVSA